MKKLRAISLFVGFLLLFGLYSPQKAEAQIYCPQSIFGQQGRTPSAGEWWVCINYLQNGVNSTLSLTSLPNGDIFIGSPFGVPTPRALSGDGTLVSSGALTVTKTNGVPFGTAAVVNVPISAANGGTGEAGTITGALKGNGTSPATQAACADLSNGAGGCSTPVGTSGANLGLLNANKTDSGNNTFSGTNNFTGPLQIGGTVVSSLATAAPDGISVQVSGGVLSAFDGAGVFFLSKYVPSPGTDDCPAIQNALNDAATYGAANGSGAVVGDGVVHNCQTQITYDPSVTSVDWRGGGLDAHTASFTGPLITVAQSHTPPHNSGGGTGNYYQTYKNVFRNGFFNGAGKAGNIDLFYFQSSTGIDPSYNSRSLFQNIAGKNFRYGEQYGNNAYLVDFMNTEYHDMHYAIYVPLAPALSNSGENIAHFYGSIGESDQAVLIGQAGFTANFFSFSFDFNTTWMESDYSRITCTQCHFEQRYNSFTTPPFVLGDYTGSNIELIGGDIVIDGNTAISGTSCLMTVAPTARMFMDHVYMQGIFFTSGVMACGGGLVQIQNSESTKFGATIVSNYNAVRAFNFNTDTEVRTTNLLSDGNFETGSITDLIWIGADTATIVSRTIGTNLSLSLSTDTARYGTHSLKATKVGGTGTAAGFYVAAPFTRMQLPAHVGSYSTLGSYTGSFTIALEYLQIDGYDGNGIPVVGYNSGAISNSGATTVTLSGSPIAWTGDGQNIGPAEYLRPSAWTTHIVLYVDLTNAPAGNYYFDGEVFNSN